MNGFYIKRRVVILAVLFAAFFSYITYYYGKLASKPPVTAAPVPVAKVERGAIVDRNGKPVAVQTTFYDFGITPNLIKDPALFSSLIAPVVGMAPLEIQNIIDTASKNERKFTYIKKKISQEQHDELLKILNTYSYRTYCSFDPVPGRIYPMNETASQLIGYMGKDGFGLSGIEYSMQTELSPPIREGETGTVYGKNIYLTIDSNLQYELEKIARSAMEETQAENITIIASQVKTGEILSYVCLPAVNLNEYPSYSPEQREDRPAVRSYEPGSVFKIFSSAAYFDSGSINAETTFVCDGIYEKTTNLGEKIQIKCLDHHGTLTTREALKYSCNDALAQMSETLDAEPFLAYLHKFGFGEKTGVELPSEAKGSIKNPDSKLWSARSQATISIGQEIGVSALQMVQATNTIANGGLPVKLTFIHSIKDKDGKDEYVHVPEYGSRVIKKASADYILSCMETTAKTGTGHRASLGDISIGVKTGTAQIYDANTKRYSETDFISNCIAVFPIENPEVVLYIVIEKAKGETYAGRIVAPVIAKAADEIIDVLGMSREKAPSVVHSGHSSITSSAPVQINKYVPDFIGMPKRDLLPLLDRKDIKVVINGEGWVVSQTPEAGTPITENMTIEFNLE